MASDAQGADITDMSSDPYVQLGFSTTTLRTEPAIAAHAHNSRMFRVGANFVNTGARGFRRFPESSVRTLSLAPPVLPPLVA